VAQHLSVDDEDVEDRMEYTDPTINLLTDKDELTYGNPTGGAGQDLDERDNPHFRGVSDEV
jgi:hypothetical protein